MADAAAERICRGGRPPAEVVGVAIVAITTAVDTVEVDPEVADPAAAVVLEVVASLEVADLVEGLD